MGGWFSSLFSSISEVFSDSAGPRKILMLGLDNAGKTTILYSMKLGETITTAPTVGFNVESVAVGNVTVEVWDIGGQNRIRSLWKRYFEDTAALIFVVDGNDTARIDESCKALFDVLSSDELDGVVVLVFLNKSDQPEYVGTEKYEQQLKPDMLPNKSVVRVQECCALQGEGIKEGFEWVAEELKQRRT